jgi:hypothetical protein
MESSSRGVDDEDDDDDDDDDDAADSDDVVGDATGGGVEEGLCVSDDAAVDAVADAAAAEGWSSTSSCSCTRSMNGSNSSSKPPHPSPADEHDIKLQTAREHIRWVVEWQDWKHCARDPHSKKHTYRESIYRRCVPLKTRRMSSLSESIVIRSPGDAAEES